MNISTSANRLEALTRELSSQWEQTKELWKDTKSREFERKFMDELRANVNSAISGIGELNRILTKARNDCE
jgi:hypothetical protein